MNETEYKQEHKIMWNYITEMSKIKDYFIYEYVKTLEDYKTADGGIKK